MGNVFISHRGADTSDAQRLGDAIRAAGHAVWLDVWEIGIGDSVVKQINEGLEGATYVIVCYSSSGVEAPWILWIDRNKVRARPIRRWRRTNPTSCLTSHFNKDVPVDNISGRKREELTRKGNGVTSQHGISSQTFRRREFSQASPGVSLTLANAAATTVAQAVVILNRPDLE